jgi:NADPH:quinone reductase-like Zn-dependent oxidoreductase
VRAAGVQRLGGSIEALELPSPREPRSDEVLIGVRACGVGNWDEFARTGDWDLGIGPPLALGVEAAGLVIAAGAEVMHVKVGDQVTVHSLPLREQGAWAAQHLAPAEHAALVPTGVSFEAAATVPVPALTAEQAIADALHVRAGQTVLVHGGGGVTGGMLVQLAAHRGATVIATAGPASAARLAAMGASTILDYHDPDWSDRVRALTGDGADAAANAVRDGSGDAVRALRDGGRLATLTADLPAAERGISMDSVQVAPDGNRLSHLVGLLAQGILTVSVADRLALEEAGAAPAHARHGAHGKAIVLQPGD